MLPALPTPGCATSHNPRMVSIIGVNGWYREKSFRTVGIVCAGTNAADRNGCDQHYVTVTRNRNRCSASGLSVGRACG